MQLGRRETENEGWGNEGKTKRKEARERQELVKYCMEKEECRPRPSDLKPSAVIPWILIPKACLLKMVVALRVQSPSMQGLQGCQGSPAAAAAVSYYCHKLLLSRRGRKQKLLDTSIFLSSLSIHNPYTGRKKEFSSSGLGTI